LVFWFLNWIEMKTPLQNQTIWFGFSAQTKQCTPLIGTVTFIKMSQSEP
jgi:hypothetical protein